MDLGDPVTFWQRLAAALGILLALLASGHVILYKRDSRAAVLWVGVIWLAPIVGPFLYLGLGVNRIRRRAYFLRSGAGLPHPAFSMAPLPPHADVGALPGCGPLQGLATLVSKVVSEPLMPGNSVDPLMNGDEAYPAMVQAIEAARESVALSTYIFDNDTAGRRFAEALACAVERGVEVRVIIDDTGARYSFPSIVPALRKKRVPVTRFLPSLLPWRFMSINMRNHRKILVVDGRTGFTGGMNIRQGHMLKDRPRGATRDLHFKIQGPAVAQLQQLFAQDWHFCTREVLRGPVWFPPLESAGSVAARGIADGPDEAFEIFRWTVLGALACAQKSVRIVTPYFLPDLAMISGLNLAAMRGVEVDIVLPARSNLPYVHWAMFAIIWQVLQRGCRVWLTPPPFDHSKLMLVDNCWSLLGSANWDPRSYRLNFEFNLECYDRALAESLESVVREKIASAHRLTLEEVDARPLPVKLRDGVFRLFTPFL
jgi:cardiolipin synthase A/B